jgi:excisionase family DNA binding protein
MTQHDMIEIAGRRFVTVSGLSALFNVHKRTIQVWAADRGIPLIRIGNLMIFDIDDVKRWLLQHKHMTVE